MGQSGRRAVKTLVLLVSVALLLGAAVSTILFFELQSIRSFSSGLTGLRVPALAPPPPRFAGGDRPAADADSRGTVSGATAPVAAEPSRRPNRSAVADPVLRYLLDRYIDRGSSDIQVCGQLDTLTAAAPLSPESFSLALAAAASGQARSDPFIEAAIAPIGVLLRTPAVAQALESIVEARTGADPAMTSTPEFQTAISQGAIALVRSKAIFDRAAQRAYHLFALSVVASQRPELAGDERFQELCSSIQAAAEAASPNEAPADILREKAAMLSLLAELGVSPSQAGFNYNMGNSLRAQITDQSFIVDVPWLRQAADTVLILVAPRP